MDKFDRQEVEQLNTQEWEREEEETVEYLLSREVLAVIKAVVAGMDEDPGHSDLDNEQPIHVSMTLGDYRRAKRLFWQMKKEQ